MASLAARFESRWTRVRLRLPYDEGGRLSELYALGTPIEERTDTPEGVIVVARLPRRDLTRFAPYLIAEAVPPIAETPPARGSPPDRAADHASSSRRGGPGARVRRRRGAGPRRLREAVLAPGERALVGTGLAVAIPEGYAGFVQPRSGLPRSTGSRS